MVRSGSAAFRFGERVGETVAGVAIASRFGLDLPELAQLARGQRAGP